MKIKSLNDTPTYRSIQFWVDTLDQLAAVPFDFYDVFSKEMCITSLTLLAMNKKGIQEDRGTWPYVEGYLLDTVKRSALFAYANEHHAFADPCLEMTFEEANKTALVAASKKNPQLIRDIAPVVHAFRRYSANGLRENVKHHGTYNDYATAILHDLAIVAFAYLRENIRDTVKAAIHVFDQDKLEKFMKKVVSAKLPESVWATDYFAKKYHKAVKDIFRSYLESAR